MKIKTMTPTHIKRHTTKYGYPPTCSACHKPIQPQTQYEVVASGRRTSRHFFCQTCSNRPILIYQPKGAKKLK